MKKKAVFSKKVFASLCMATLVSMGCSTVPSAGTSGSVFREGQALYAGKAYEGTVIAIQDIEIEQNSQLAQIVSGGLGALLGGTAGSQVGGGNGRTVAATTGAVLGGVAGVAVARNVGVARVPGKAITVRVNKGKILQIAQADDAKAQFRVGESVLVSENKGDGNTAYRVMKLGG